MLDHDGRQRVAVPGRRDGGRAREAGVHVGRVEGIAGGRGVDRFRPGRRGEMNQPALVEHVRAMGEAATRSADATAARQEPRAPRCRSCVRSSPSTRS